MSEINYYERREIANSIMSSINPSTGGHPKWIKLYLEGKTNNKKGITLENGQMLHLYTENPEAFLVADVDRPNEKICSIADEYLKIKDAYLGMPKDDILVICARSVGYSNNKGDIKLIEGMKKTSLYEYIEELEKFDPTKIILTSATKQIVENSIETLKNHVMCNEYLFNQDNSLDIQSEVEVYFTLFGIDCKAKPDRIRINHKKKTIELIDLKTMGKKGSIFFNESFEFYHYYRQMAFYTYALKTIYPEYSVKCFMPVVSYYNYTANCYHITDSQIDRGEIEYTELLLRIKWHMERNLWDYSKEEYENNYVLNL